MVVSSIELKMRYAMAPQPEEDKSKGKKSEEMKQEWTLSQRADMRRAARKRII